MTAILSAKGDFDGTTGGHNEGIFTLAIGNLRDYLAKLFGTDGNFDTAIQTLKVANADYVGNFALTQGTVAANALTIAVKKRDGSDATSADPIVLSQPSIVSSAQSYLVRTISAALSLTIPSGASLGHVSGADEAIYVYLLDNAGAQEIAVSTNFFGMSGVMSTTAISGSATSRTVAYSSVARTSLSFICLGMYRSTQTTAGTWLAVPTAVVTSRSELLKRATDIINTATTLNKPLRGAIATLTSSASITPDFSLSNNFTLTLASTTTINNPTNAVAGQAGSIFITQGGSGGYLASFGSNWKFEGGVAGVPALTAAVGAVDRLDYLVKSSTEIHARLASDVKA